MIYTKLGDGGKTIICNGKCMYKDEAIIEALGAVDECNSAIGLSIALLNEYMASSCCISQLNKIQEILFKAGSSIASSYEEVFDDTVVLSVEAWIDDFEKELLPLDHFILPGGNILSSMLHFARTVCRRAERRVVAMHCGKSQSIVQFLNRLSDYLFVVARFLQ